MTGGSNSRRRASVVIAAHNEELGIGRCLDELLAASSELDLQIIVVCNGCTDRTASIASSYGEPIEVLELERAGKISALNAGDSCATWFPRFYVDADVRLSPASLVAMVDTLEEPGVHAVVPTMQPELSDRPWTVRSYFTVWSELPYFREGIASSGAYGLSEDGRARFDCFPDVLSDDHFALSLFARGERRVALGATSTIEAPWSLREIVKIKTRGFLGNRQLGDRRQTSEQDQRRSSWAGVVARRPALWLHAPLYVVVNAVAELRARRRWSSGDFSWERDDSTRLRQA